MTAHVTDERAGEEVANKSALCYFAVTTPGLSATRWLSHVLAAHPDVYVAHGKFALDSVIAGDFLKEKGTANLESLTRGNETRDFYETRPLEEVLTLYRGIRPGARAYGCVHSYTLHALALAAESADTLADMRIVNLVRHPVDFIASHAALVRAAEKHPPLYGFYLGQAFPEALRQFPELFLMKCPDYRAFIAFVVSCHAVGNLLFDMCYPEARHVRMETLTTSADTLHELCEELTGLKYSRQALEQFIRVGAINQHRPGPTRLTPRETYAHWEVWQQDVAHLMIPGLVLDWLEGLGYDLGMFREKPSAASASQSRCLADCLRSFDQRHPFLAFMTPTGLTRAQIVEADLQGFGLIHRDDKRYGLARSLEVAAASHADREALNELEEDGLCVSGDNIAQLWHGIARILSSSPQLVEEHHGYNVIAFRQRWYAAPRGLALNLERMRCPERKQLMRAGKLFAAASREALKQQIGSRGPSPGRSQRRPNEVVHSAAVRNTANSVAEARLEAVA
jgi:hypothetical protein